jgi:DNA oxidative demethylase
MAIMPEAFLKLATTAGEEAGFRLFEPDACLINHYETGARLFLHQDKDERDFYQPIVSVSLGIPAVFLFGGSARSDKTMRVHVAARRRSGLGRSGETSLPRRRAAQAGLSSSTG